MKKNQTMKIVSTFLCIIMSMTTFSTVTANSTETSSIADPQPESLTYTFLFNEPVLKEKIIEKGTYTEIQLAGAFSIGEMTGAPSYLAKPVQLLLPQGMKISSIKVTGEPVEVNTKALGLDLLKNPIEPLQPSVPIGEPCPTFVFDEDSYKTDSVIPSQLYENLQVGFCHGYTIASVTLHPTQYNPVKGQLSYIKAMTISFSLEKTDDVTPFYRNNQADKTWVEHVVYNPEMTDSYDGDYVTTEYTGGLCSPSDNGGLGYDYVIITRTALFDFTGTEYNWDNLIAGKESQGLHATKVSVEDILGCPGYRNANPLFDDIPARIREFCKDAYEDWGLQYVLIAGDNDDFNPDTKIERRLLNYGPPGFPGIDVDSDLYWSNLDNNFNNNMDDRWGEQEDGGFDFYSELFIGSIPCDTPQDISNWLTKSLYYENNVDAEYLDNAAFYSGALSWHVEGDDCIDFSAVKGTNSWLGPGNPDHPEIYPSWLGFLYGFETWNQNNPNFAFDLSVKWTGEQNPNDGNPSWTGGTTATAVAGMRDAINNDQVTLISAVAHANPYLSMNVFDTPAHASLSDPTYQGPYWSTDYHNTKPFFIHDYGCHCGDMDDVDDGVLDCMLFQSNTNLAFGCVYNTGFGYGNSFSTNGSSMVQQKLFWDYLFDTQNNSISPLYWQLGRAMAYSKDTMTPTIHWNYYWRAIIESCLLFADPALCIKPPQQPAFLVLDKFPRETDIHGVIELRGSVGGEQFQRYTVEYRKESIPDSWIQLSTSFTPVIHGLLTTLDTTLLEDDSYVFRVILYADNGVYQDSFSFLTNNQYNIIIVDDNNINGPWDGTTEHPFQHIQDGVDAAGRGDMIYVKHGLYVESVKLYRQVMLIGEDKTDTIIQSTPDSNDINVVSLLAGDSTLCGFTIEKIDSPAMDEGAAISISSDNNCVMNNIIPLSVLYGISIDHATHNRISKNYITNTDGGINVAYSSDNKISDNNIVNNVEGADGIILYSSSDNVISRNQIVSNQNGIKLWHSCITNNIMDNTLEENRDYGIYFSDPSGELSVNCIFHNNFIDNRINAFDTSTAEHDCINLWYDNYWSDYIALYPDAHEIGNTGKWDTPYDIIGAVSIDNTPLVHQWVSVDAEPPLLLDMTPSTGTTGDVILFQVYAVDNVGVSRVMLGASQDDDLNPPVRMTQDGEIWSSPYTVSSGSESPLLYNFHVVDTSGNSANMYPLASPGVVTIRDNDPSVTHCTVNGNIITLSATDNCAGVAVTKYLLAIWVNNHWQLITPQGSYATYTGPITRTPGRYLLNYYSVDNEGNTETNHQQIFTIPNIIIIISPNGGELWQRGLTQTIRWSSESHCGSKVLISISCDAGKTWTMLSSAPNTPGKNSYSWTIPKNFPSSSACVMKIESADDKAISGVSAQFSLK
jgi:parallel beta-helix repeat protein